MYNSIYSEVFLHWGNLYPPGENIQQDVACFYIHYCAAKISLNIE